MIEGYAFVLREPRGGWRRRAASHGSLRDESRDREQPWREEKTGSLFRVTRPGGEVPASNFEGWKLLGERVVQIYTMQFGSVFGKGTTDITSIVGQFYKDLLNQ